MGKIIKEKIPIKLVRNDTEDTKTFRFAVPADFDFVPGQFVILSLWHKKDGVEKEIKRSYSIASSPTEKGHIDLTIKLYPNGEFSPKIFSLKEGDSCGVHGPFGKFILDDSRTKMAFITAGSGVTPFRSMIKYCLDKRLSVEMVMLYSSKTPKDIIYKEEFDSWKNPNLKIIHTITRPDGTGWSGQTGRISPELIRKYIDVENSDFYLCGPEEFLNSMIDILKTLGVEKERIKKEQW